MRAVVVHEPGDADVLVLAEVPAPTLQPGEVLLDIVASGVNRADLLQRRGYYPPPEGESDIIGLEVSGRVAAVAPDVSSWSVGDECVALLAGGGYAEQVAVPAGQCVPVPPGVDLVSAAGYLEVAATVVSNLDHVRLATGETFLVHGGAGGIGSLAIPYAKQLGATVLTTAGSSDKLDLCRERGADYAFNYKDDWLSEVKKTVGGVDVLLDIMGAKYLDLNLKALARGGRLVVIGLQGGTKGTLDLGRLLAIGATVTATSLRFRPTAEKVAICRDVVERVWPLISSGAIPHLPISRFAFRDVVAAHRHLEQGGSAGKIVLVH